MVSHVTAYINTDHVLSNEEIDYLEDLTLIESCSKVIIGSYNASKSINSNISISEQLGSNFSLPHDFNNSTTVVWNRGPSELNRENGKPNLNNEVQLTNSSIFNVYSALAIDRNDGVNSTFSSREKLMFTDGTVL